MTQRQQRTIRGLIAASLAVFIAALFHVAGGGAATPIGLVASVILAAPLCVFLAGRRTRLWSLGLSVAFGQLAFHLLFGLGQPSGVRFSGDTGMAGMAGMRLHVAGAGGASVSLAAPAMWASHAAAALLTIVAIRYGERVLRRMSELAARFLVRALRLIRTTVAPRVRVVAPESAPRIRFSLFLSSAWRHRGPPVVRVRLATAG